MPLKLNCGFSKKVGEANYGSRGATVALELEVEADLVASPQRLHERIRQLFRLAKESVEEELNGNGQATVSAEGNGHQRQRPSRPATHSQVRAIHAISDRQRVDLPGLSQKRFQIEQPDGLSITEASTLIDELKCNGNGVGGRR
jgi:hypothetical protein